MADIRKIKTKKNIEMAFVTLLNERNFKSITVDEICKQAMTSRSTFYLHYLDKYDLLNQLVETQFSVFEKIVDKRVEGLISGQFEETITHFYNELVNNKQTIQALFTINEPEFNLKQKFEDTLYQHWLKYLGEKTSLKYNELIAKFGASIVFDTLNWAFENGIDDETLLFVENIRKKILEMSTSLKEVHDEP
ncbi:TetR family transcriptional regulator [Leuconostoc suionicum]|uniref:TetR/AcrR family transcriptional regulator n=1 Tax=Leuconostoc suionicum TaxID=1511761 RepID=UPI0024ADD957|nr:TetR family transcriptional regulator [Leuconostoc suionicum]MDI6497543.1 TetR family transcriptional regulator [Leuconostoc suionicum]MDI6499614.1 TetR family transcriptional regulator [Leuconostoc suionicum]MDI6501696.1 TetR family transcriptional regulator [Leuconostoc suionicum]MDI6613588.1 TetR family transcriptional regulator [Leuconostoc suionicum]MDI6664614.1 TetR family transcriptional regulator [Leuconostoc suionicum]